MAGKFTVELVTAEAKVLSTEADFVVARGGAGELGMYPNHLPLLTTLKPGEIKVRNGSEEQFLFVSGGFMEVVHDRITILADAAEFADEIDQARAEEARTRAQEALASDSTNADAAAALERAMFRLKVSEIRRRHRG